jgi:FkbM family methyltransferase
MLLSHAQNFEDVILWRALRHVDKGFYIDVGAQDPVIDSVSAGFYAKGWRGVHVEPSPAFAEKLRAARPDEEVLQLALGTCRLPMRFYELSDTGLSTGNARIAAQHKASGYTVQELEVDCLTLDKLLDQHRHRDVHWLKIDVEGAETSVIEGWLPSRVRPWIVVIEAIIPLTREPAFAEWDPMLRGLGYDFTYFDGLNRFYVSRKHPELAAAFGPGPNLFDDFVLAGRSSAPYHAELLRQAAAGSPSAPEMLAALSRSNTALVATLAHARADLEAQGRELSAARRRLVRKSRRIRKVRTQTRLLETRLQASEQELAATRMELADLGARCHQVWELASNLTRQADLTRNSLSWRITAPLRSLKQLALGTRDARSRAMASARRATAWPFARVGGYAADTALAYVRRRPVLKHRIARGLAHVPRLQRRVAQLSVQRAAGPARPPAVPVDAPALQAVPGVDLGQYPASVRRTHLHLKLARGLGT